METDVLVLFAEEQEAQGGKGLVQGQNQSQIRALGFFSPKAWQSQMTTPFLSSPTSLI